MPSTTRKDQYGTLLPGAGFTFDVNPFTSVATPIHTDFPYTTLFRSSNDGLLCIDHVRKGTYHVTETKIPDGYFGDPQNATITVSAASTCSATSVTAHLCTPVTH